MRVKNKEIIIITLVATFFGIMMSFNLSIASGVLLFLEKTFEIPFFYKKHIVSMVVLGGILGVIFGGFFSDRYGRKKTWIIAAIFYLIGGSLSTLSYSLHLFLIARFLTGLGVGLASVAIPTYLGEIAPPENRGKIVTSFQLAVTIGILVAYLINYLIKDTQNWQFAFVVGFCMSMIGSLSLFLIPDSKKKETQSVGKLPSMPLIVGIGLAIFQQITGINAIIYYGPTIFDYLGFNSLSAKFLATLGIGFVNMIATIIALKFIDKLGRRYLLLIGLVGMSFSLGVLYLFSLNPFLSVLFIISYIVFFAMSIGPILWVIIAEIFPPSLRAKGVSLSLFMNWIFTYLVAYTFLPLLTNMGLAEVFGIFALASLVASLFVYFFVPETKGKTLEEIQLHWKK